MILQGSTLDVVFGMVKCGKLPIEWSESSEAEVFGADEVCVTWSSKEIVAVVDLDGRTIGNGKPGPVFRRAWQLYQDFKSEVMRAKQQARAA